MLTNIERETVINFNEDESQASVYTFNKKLINKLLKISGEYPDELHIAKQHHGVYEFTIPKRWVKVNPPKKYSEDTKQKMREHMARIRSQQEE